MCKGYNGTCNVTNNVTLNVTYVTQVHIKNMINDKYYTNVIYYKGVPVSDEICLYGIDGRMVDLLIIVRPSISESVYKKFEVRLAMDQENYSALCFYPHEGIVEIDQRHAGLPDGSADNARHSVGQNPDGSADSARHSVGQNPVRPADCTRYSVGESLDGNISLRIIMNGHSAEIYINEARHVATMDIPTDLSADCIAFHTDGNATIDVTKREIKM